MLSHWSELVHRAEGKDQGCNGGTAERAQPGAKDAILHVSSQRSQALHLTNLHGSSVLQGVDPDHKKKMIKSEEAKVIKAGKSTHAGPGYRNSRMDWWALALKLTVDSVQIQVIPSPFGSKVSSKTFLRVLTPCPGTRSTPYLRASGLQHASGVSVAEEASSGALHLFLSM